MANIAKDILDTTGNTPLVRVNRLTGAGQAVIYAKIEARAPGFSVKCRIAKAMIDDALASGELQPGTTVVEPTSGNTGIGLAIACAVRGFPLILTMPETMSMERRQILRLFGAKLELTPGAEGMKGAIARAETLSKEMPKAWMPRQFNNPSNPKVHRETTALEILRDTDGDFDIFVSGVGTGGTLTGCAEVFKAKKPGVRIVAVEPASSPVLAGGQPGKHKIQGIGAGFVPQVLRSELIDEIIAVSDDEAGACARDMAREEGIFGGISCGAAMHAARVLAVRPENAGKKIVVILPDTGERYLSTWLWDEYRG